MQRVCHGNTVGSVTIGSGPEGGHDIISFSHSSTGNNGDFCHSRNSSDESQVTSPTRTLLVDAGNEDFARALRTALFCPGDSVPAGRLPAAVRVGFPAVGFPLRVDLEDNGLAPELVCKLGNQLWSFNRSGIDGDLVSSSKKCCAHIRNAFDSAADSDGAENVLCRSLNEVKQSIASVEA